MMPPEDIAAIRGLLQEALRPFEGLPKTVQDLTDEVVRLRAVVERLDPRVDDLAGEVRQHSRVLREVEPLLQRFSDIADHVMPEFVRQQQGMQGEINRLDRESQRAAAGDDP